MVDKDRTDTDGQIWTKVVKDVQGQDKDGGRTDSQERDNQRKTENDRQG